MRTPSGPHLKTLGPLASLLVAELHERGRSLFSLRDVQEITRLEPGLARSFMAKLVVRGIATRLKPGLFILVPFELGRARHFTGNPYPIARELAGGRAYYISHASAMDIHQMLTQPQFVVYVSTPRALRPKIIHGTQFRFLHCKRRDLFGIMEHWVDKTEKVAVSDMERTVIDGVKQPDYCGGIVGVTKGFWMHRKDLDPKRLVDYALRLRVGAVIRRLGFIMELCGVEAPQQLTRLRQALTETHTLLDPGLPAEGHFQRRWRLRLNVTPEELRAAVRT